MALGRSPVICTRALGRSPPRACRPCHARATKVAVIVGPRGAADDLIRALNARQLCQHRHAVYCAKLACAER